MIIQSAQVRILVIGIFTLLSSIVISGCDAESIPEVYTITANIPDAENAFLTDNGRLFISGGTQLHEYTQPQGSQTVFSISNGQIMGMAQVSNYLYVIVLDMYEEMDFTIDIKKYYKDGLIRAALEYLTDAIEAKKLMRADLNQSPLSFQTVHEFQDLVFPNGMVADANGDLYVADLTYLPVGGIAKLTLSNDNPPQITETRWLTPSQNALAANGMAIKDQTIYFTDMDILSFEGFIKKVKIIDGHPGIVRTIYSAKTLFDDLTYTNYGSREGLIVTDFFNGRLIFSDRYGFVEEEVTDSDTFDNPSSVIRGRGPMFSSDELLVTEKGTIGDSNPAVGNKLVGILMP